MVFMISRRALLATSALFTMGTASVRASAPRSPSERLAALEKRSGGRLGVAILDTRTGLKATHRADERFAMCSTFKALAAAAVLARADAGKEDLNRRISYGREKLIFWSPVTKNHADGPGMTLAELCEAAVTMSDNTAGNLLLESLGGPKGLTAFFRSLGDEVSRLDRWEPELNDVPPGDLRDTTTPEAMLGSLRSVVLGDALSPNSRQRLAGWLIGCKTGDKRLRAGFPAGWTVGDKTGTGSTVASDIAVAWARSGATLVVSAYLEAPQLPAPKRDGIFREIGEIASEMADLN
ncbi:class A beta-lactamase [Chelativorans multitrophicus]|uniref:class A beta-lactamase n=1 Tax=Chelativorans multitrophicus TaxID=449973 RepID=UPI00140C5E4B